MENITKLVVLLCLACALPVQAQRGLKPHAKPRATSKAHLSAYRPMYGAVYQSIAWNPALPLPGYVGVDRSRIYETVSVTQKRSWLEQQRRDLKAWQLKRKHAKMVALAQQMAALPKLQEAQTFYTDDLTDFILQEHHLRQLPALPFIERPDYLYRGLSLESEGCNLQRILQHGLLVKDVGQYSNSLLLSLANSPYDAAAISSSKYTNLTSSPQTALHYAFRKVNQSKDILPVIVSVTGEPENSHTVRVQYDIPADRLSDVIALLQLNGKPTWCSVKLEGSSFKITPYEVK